MLQLKRAVGQQHLVEAEHQELQLDPIIYLPAKVFAESVVMQKDEQIPQVLIKLNGKEKLRKRRHGRCTSHSGLFP